MVRTLLAALAVLSLLSAPAQAAKREPHHVTRLALDTMRPGSAFDCDTERGTSWYGSTARCLAELCRGQNVVNASIVGGDGRLRPNPCAHTRDDRR